jgi:hypothetical protein
VEVTGLVDEKWEGGSGLMAVSFLSGLVSVACDESWRVVWLQGQVGYGNDLIVAGSCDRNQVSIAVGPW